MTQQGTHFTITDPTAITLFGLRGQRNILGEWAMDVKWAPPSVESYMFTEVGASSALSDVASALEQACDDGQAEHIECIQLSSRVAVILFLEGALPASAFERAVETEDAVYLSLTVAGRAWSVKICSEFEVPPLVLVFRAPVHA